ncbi:MAG TPA: two-component regulator propeller domain-containing protein [Flavobacteriales bacterium]|nr:two-component regulator propeller domain-containing protein [Flavobacteriales bacterium]
MRRLLIFFLFVGPVIGVSFGQATPKRVRAELITVDHGLPQGLIWSILQDQQGFLWFATKDGLARYDGYEYRVFRNIPGDTTSLAGNHITALLEDSLGFLWIGTEQDGLHRYDPRTGRFARIKRDPRLGQLAGIVSIESDTHGDLWVLEYSGGLCVVPNGVAAGPLPALGAAADHYPKLELNALRSIRATLNGDLWLLERDELSVWARTSDGLVERLRWKVPWPWVEFEHPPGLLHHASAGHMLLVWEKRVIVFDERSVEVVDTLELPGLQFRGSELVIDAQDRLWGEGLDKNWFRMDLRTGTTEVIKPELEGGHALPGTGFLAWIMDRTGVVWAGTSGYGLVKYRSSTERFQTFRFQDSPIQHSAIVATDLEGRELLVHEELMALNATEGVLKSIAVIDALDARGLEPSWGVCARDPSGCYWLGGGSQHERDGLYVFDPRTKELLSVPFAPEDEVAAVYPGLGKEVWILSNRPGEKDRNWLTQVDTRTRTTLQRFEFPGPIRSGTYREIACWRFASDSTIWMATGNGVYGLEARTGNWSHYMHDDQDSTSIPGNEVFSLCFDPDEPDKFMWVGTEGKGMARMDLRTGQCDHTITTEQGLPNDVVYGILPDAHNNLWISTNQGLCRFDPRTGAKKTYTMADGIAGNEFNRYSAEASADGLLYFGGMEGITWFDPEDFYTEADPSPTRITGLKLLNRPVTVSDNTSFLQVPITWLDELTLPYSERMITFAFANMDLSVPGQNEYRYILEGMNTNWIENGKGHEATFTNLDPGSYTFRVQGRNSEGRWDEQGTTLLLTITPPWWGTWWFRLLMALILTSIAVAFFRYRLARAMEVVNVRDQIARDLHDEIGSTLSSVALFSTVARKKAGTKVPEATEMLDRITESTTSVMEAMNDIVWAVNAENDDMDHVVQRMRSYAVRLTEAGSCTLEFTIENGLERIHLGMSQRKNLYLIFKEAVNNALKYAEPTVLRVDVSRNGPSIVMQVADNGKGFDPDAPAAGSSGGNGLGNMRKRAKDMGGELHVDTGPGAGTTVELRFKASEAQISLDPMMDGVHPGT